MDSDKPLSYLQFATVFIVFGVVLIAFRGPWDLLRIVGLTIACVALILFVIAKVQLGDSFSVEPIAKTLVVRGIYSKICHPMYLFSALFFFGLILYVGRTWLLLIFLILIPVQILRMRREDQVLEEKFGEEHRRYRQNTWF